MREVREETGLEVTAGPVGVVDRALPGGGVLEIRDYVANITGGTLRPGDDADDARWVSPGDMASLPLTSGLAEALTGWGVLP